MIRKIYIFLCSLLTFFLFAAPAFAHVVVKPNQLGVASTQIFSISVPSEKDTPTVAVRLLIPDGLEYVTPNVKSGWTIDVKKQGDGEDAKVTEIDWSEGSIPPGQRDEFLFQAKVPAKETTINWKAYQTYADGTVTSWDQNPNTMKGMSDDQMEAMETQGKGPFSQTKIVNDLSTQTMPTDAKKQSENNETNPLIWLGVIGFALSVISLVRQSQKN